jgi:hypothetical protein
VSGRRAYLVIDWFELVLATDGLTSTDVAVAAAYRTFMNGRGECWPSLPAIAEKAHCSLSTARRSLRKLERLELVLTDPGGGRHKPNRVRVNPVTLTAFQQRNPVTDDLNPVTMTAEGVQKASKTPTASSLSTPKKKKGGRAGARRPKKINTAGAHLKPDGSPDFDYLAVEESA